MSTTQVIVGLNSRSTHEAVAEKTEAMGTAMNGNLSFPSPPFTPADMMKQAADLRAKVKARNDSRVALAAANEELRASRKKTVDMVVTQGAYVAIASNGDAAKAKTAAVALRGKPVRAKSLVAPKAPGLVLGNVPHQVKVQLRAYKRANDRRVEMTTDPSKVDSWILAGVTTSSSLLVDGLATGVHSFRVIAVNGDLTSPPSGVVTIFVP